MRASNLAFSSTIAGGAETAVLLRSASLSTGLGDLAPEWIPDDRVAFCQVGFVMDNCLFRFQQVILDRGNVTQSSEFGEGITVAAVAGCSAKSAVRARPRSSTLASRRPECARDVLKNCRQVREALLCTPLEARRAEALPIVFSRDFSVH